MAADSPSLSLLLGARAVLEYLEHAFPATSYQPGTPADYVAYRAGQQSVLAALRSLLEEPEEELDYVHRTEGP